MRVFRVQGCDHRLFHSGSTRRQRLNRVKHGTIIFAFIQRAPTLMGRARSHRFPWVWACGRCIPYTNPAEPSSCAQRQQSLRCVGTPNSDDPCEAHVEEGVRSVTPTSHRWNSGNNHTCDLRTTSRNTYAPCPSLLHLRVRKGDFYVLLSKTSPPCRIAVVTFTQEPLSNHVFLANLERKKGGGGVRA